MTILLTVLLFLVGGGSPHVKPKPRPLPILEPGSVAIDYRGGLAVADRKLNRVVRIDLPTGKRRVLVSGLRDIVNVTYDDQFRLYVGAGDRIFRFDGGRRTLLASLPGLGGFEVDHDETIVAALYENRIAFVDTAGKVSIIGGTGAEGYTGDGGPATTATFNHPHDVVLRIDREVVVADSHNGVLRRIDPAGTVTTIARRFKAPVALSAGAGNTLFVADSQAGAIYKLSPDGGTRRLVGRAIAPANITVDERDRIYVTELAGAHRLLQITNGRARVLVRGAS